MPLFLPPRGYFAFAAGAAAGFAPADATTYTFGNQPGINPGIGDTVWALLMTRPGRVRRVSGVFAVLGTSGSAQNSTIRVRNPSAATTENVTTTLAATFGANVFLNTAMSLTFAAGEGLSMQLVCPTWTTNPTTTFLTGMIEVEFTG